MPSFKDTFWSLWAISGNTLDDEAHTVRQCIGWWLVFLYISGCYWWRQFQYCIGCLMWFLPGELHSLSWYARTCLSSNSICIWHDDVIKWNIFRVTGHLCEPVNSAHKGQCRGAFLFSLICAWINRWVNNREAGDLRRYCAHYDVIVMVMTCIEAKFWDWTSCARRCCKKMPFLADLQSRNCRLCRLAYTFG